jgi:hypothetical protein
MWPPADITALPTLQEVIDAKLAIEEVKIQLNDALLALAQAQLRVDEINKELFEREAWIAPIRYLSFDALSLVFEFCGEDDWRTPLVISEVSRYWRDTVLATPRAWAFLRLHDFRNEHQIIYHFFSRSGHCPLHISLPTMMAHPSRILSGVEKRLKCLSIQDTNDYVKGRVFPILDRLTLLFAYDRPTEISRFNDVQFPSLRHLICETYLTNSLSGLSGVVQWEFPPLQTLSLRMTGDLAWLSLLTAVKNTLISLKLQLVQQCTIQNSQISLPTLRCLDVQFSLHGPLFWPLDLKTPVLETYLELTRRSLNKSLFHEDIQNVRGMRSDRPPTLSSFPLIEILQLKEEYHAVAVLTELASNESLCPNLQEIELQSYKNRPSESLSTKLADVKRSRRVPVNLEFNYSFRRELPYAIKDRPVCPISPIALHSYQTSVRRQNVLQRALNVRSRLAGLTTFSDFSDSSWVGFDDVQRIE